MDLFIGLMIPFLGTALVGLIHPSGKAPVKKFSKTY